MKDYLNKRLKVLQEELSKARSSDHNEELKEIQIAMLHSRIAEIDLMLMAIDNEIINQ